MYGPKTRFVTPDGDLAFDEVKEDESFIVLTHTGAMKRAVVVRGDKREMRLLTIVRGGMKAQLLVDKDHRMIHFNDIMNMPALGELVEDMHMMRSPSRFMWIDGEYCQVLWNGDDTPELCWRVESIAEGGTSEAWTLKVEQMGTFSLAEGIIVN